MASRLLVALAVASTAAQAEFPKCGVRVVRGNGKKSGCVTDAYATKYDGRRLAFACCDSEADTCTRKDEDGVCYVGHNAIDYESWNWRLAMDKCAAEGKVLCGVDEPCKGSSCNYDKRYQWTAEECQAGDADFPVGCESTDEPTGEPTAKPAGEPTAETTLAPVGEPTGAPTAEFPFCGVRAFRNNGNEVKCVSDPYQTDDRVGAFACCVGDTCSRLDNDEQCFAGHNGEDRKDWYAATAACAAEGKVLCSVEEPCRNSGCGSKYQKKWHWTSEECQDGDVGLPLDCTPTPVPTRMPTDEPTGEPTARRTPHPTIKPTAAPTAKPTARPTPAPTTGPTAGPTAEPTDDWHPPRDDRRITPRPDAREIDLLTLINEKRAEGFTCPDGTVFPANGVPLVFDCRMWSAARFHSQDMADTPYFSHKSQGGQCDGEQAPCRCEEAEVSCGAESIIAGSGDPAALRWQMLTSELQLYLCTNIGKADYTMAAVGYAVGDDPDTDIEPPTSPASDQGDYKGHYWTILFGPGESETDGDDSWRVPDTSCFTEDPTIAVKVSATIAGVTTDAFQNAMFVDAFKTTVAAAINGIEADMVTNLKVDGVPVSRRLTEGVDVTYEIVSPAADYDDVDVLSSVVSTSLAAAADTFVADIQAEVDAIAAAVPTDEATQALALAGQVTFIATTSVVVSTMPPTLGPTVTPNTDVGGPAAAACLAAGGACATCCGGCTLKTPADGLDFSTGLAEGECVCFEGALSGDGYYSSPEDDDDYQEVYLTSSNDCAKVDGDYVKIYGRQGNDAIVADGEWNYLFGSEGSDTLRAEGYANILEGGGGDDTMSADGVLNFLYGGEGNDVLNAGGLDNELWGDEGDDTLSATGNGTVLEGNEGQDTLSADGNDNRLYGGQGEDTLSATGDDLYLYGDCPPGATWCVGADDTLSASGSVLTLDGGAGIDTCTYNGDQVADGAQIGNAGERCEIPTGEPTAGPTAAGRR